MKKNLPTTSVGSFNALWLRGARHTYCVSISGFVGTSTAHWSMMTRGLVSIVCVYTNHLPFTL